MMTLKSTILSFLLFTLLLFLVSSIATAQELVEQHPNVFIEDVLDVAMNANGYGVAIAGAGKVLTTDDFGQNWEVQPGSLNSTVRVDAIPGTDQSFLMVFRDEIRRSDDGGLNWISSTIPELSSNDRLERVTLPSTDVFYVCSDTDIIKTTDGGTSWTLLSPPAADVEWVDIYFDTETTGWLSDDMGNLYYTTNGGSNWIVRNSSAFEEEFVFDFLDQNIGYAAVFRDLHKTTDGGVSWELILANAFGSHMDQVEIINEQEIVFSQTALTNYVTLNGGLSIDQRAPLQYGGDHGFLTSLPDGRVWASTDYGGIAFSEDSGASWIDQLPGSKHAFLAIDFSDQNIGWAAGRKGQIAKTSDGGEEWTIAAAGLPNDPVDGETPYLVYVNSYSETEALLGATRQLFFTDDGGNSWQVLLEPEEENIRFKSVASRGDIIWVFQSNGILLKSTDRGQNWTSSQADSSPFTSFEDMYFVTEELGFIVSFNGDVIRTMDGGDTWTQVPEFTEERLQAPYFQNEQEGWILVDGFSSSVFHTSDGGESWEVVETGTNGFWTSIHANEFGAVYLFGGSSGSGRVVRSLDGGDSWESFINEYITSYQDYAYTSTNNAYTYWVCGFAGYIGRVDISLVRTQEVFTKNLAVYPNPSRGSVQLAIPQEWEQKANMRVINLYGQLVKELKATTTLDLSNLASGTYIIEVQNGSELYQAKLLLQE